MMRRQVACFLAAAITLAALGACASGPAEDDFDGGPRCADCELAEVRRVVDGDTLVTSAGRVRLYGVDAPEVGERCADGATERLQRMAGEEVRLEDGPRVEDTFARRLAYVYREDGRSIDAALVWGGFALAWTADGQHREELAELEQDARAAGRGCLW